MRGIRAALTTLGSATPVSQSACSVQSQSQGWRERERIVWRRRTHGVNLTWSGAHKSIETVYTRFDEQHNSSFSLAMENILYFAAVASMPFSTLPCPPFRSLWPARRQPAQPLSRAVHCVCVCARARVCVRFHIVIVVATLAPCVCVCTSAHKTCGCYLDYSRVNARAMATHSIVLFIPSSFFFLRFAFIRSFLLFPFCSVVRSLMAFFFCSLNASGSCA